MQKYIYLFLFLFFGLFAHLQAQVVNIPDALFKSKLIALGVDTNTDGQIQTSEALVVTSLDVSGANISDLTGVEAFVNLDSLICYYNPITYLDLTALTNLQSLNCSNSLISSLTIHTNLTYLNCSKNSITSLDVSTMTHLSYLNCYENQITILEVMNCTNLDTLICGKNQISSLALTPLTHLKRLICNSNPLYSINVSTLTNLEELNCTAIGINSLNLSGLTNLKKLDCYQNSISNLNLTGVTNLKVLRCPHNYITTLDVTNCINLETLDCQYNYLTTLDVSNLTSLKLIYCLNNHLTNLNVNNCTSLDILYCWNNQLANININNCTNLRTLSCYNNHLANLDVSASLNLLYLECNQNQLTTLDVTTLTNIEELRCGSNLITNIDVTNCPNLTYFDCSNNSLTNIDVTNCANLNNFYCSNNSLTNLAVTNCPNLMYLWCSHNSLTNLEVSGLTVLQYFQCDYNLLTSLDVSNAFTNGGGEIDCANNQLTYILMKNGTTQSIAFSGNPNLQYICADANELVSVQQQAIQYGMPNIGISTFCSTSPAGSYNTLSGTSTYDANLNGCSPLDSAYSYLKIKITDGTTTSYIYTNDEGNYTTYIDTGTYTLTPQFQNPTYFISSPASTSPNFPNNNFNLKTKDFCITPNGIHHDVEIVLMLMTNAVPGFDATYKLFFTNKGTTTDTGTITLDFMGNKMNFVNSSSAPSTQTMNQLTWAYSNLLPFESRSIVVTMNILPPPTNEIGDTLNFTASMPLTRDGTVFDNFFIVSQVEAGAFDPNDKTCLEGAFVNNDQIADYLHYLVRFQNTGNYYAQNVVIVDTIDISKFIASTVQIMETSHLASAKLEKGVLEVYFDNIQLADSFSNEPASHGYVLF